MTTTTGGTIGDDGAGKSIWTIWYHYGKKAKKWEGDGELSAVRNTEASGCCAQCFCLNLCDDLIFIVMAPVDGDCQLLSD